MPFHYTDPDGYSIETHPSATDHGPIVLIKIGGKAVYIPVNRVEELVAGLRDTARQAVGAQQ